ncbi:MAG: hypothetical protein F4017_05545 [Acidimicrobiaceae bacterium]|nr:hypothetical protein [Acidimicrobiaceae bacterium]MYK74042.1 hypothetical protein [Acidimicrobiaceae bacterium]
MPTLTDWAGPDDALGRYIAEESQRTLDSYRAQPNLVSEHANLEQDTAQGGYQHRQLFELVQNSADALAPVSTTGDPEQTGEGGSGTRKAGKEASAPAGSGRIEIRLAWARCLAARASGDGRATPRRVRPVD